MLFNYIKKPLNKSLEKLEKPPSLNIPTELVLPHIVGRPVQQYSAEKGVLCPANVVLGSFLWLT